MSNTREILMRAMAACDALETLGDTDGLRVFASEEAGEEIAEEWLARIEQTKQVCAHIHAMAVSEREFASRFKG